MAYLGNAIIIINGIINYNIPISIITIHNFQPNPDFKILIDGIIQNFNCELIEFEDRFNGYSIIKINNNNILIRYNRNLNNSYNLTFSNHELINEIYNIIMPIIPIMFKTLHYEREMTGPIEDK